MGGGAKKRAIQLTYLQNRANGLVKAMVFPVVIYRYDSWTTKKAEH